MDAQTVILFTRNGLADQLEVGEVGGMGDILEVLGKAGKVISVEADDGGGERHPRGTMGLGRTKRAARQRCAPAPRTLPCYLRRLP